MIDYNKAFHELREQLKPLYDEGEATAIANLFFDDLTGMSYTKRLTHNDALLTIEQEQRYYNGRDQLSAGMPVQYVIGHTWFMGKQFKVNEHVLIPRPETEELVQWIIDERQSGMSILDVGTGSGCIPVSLKAAITDADITACDISKDALDVAKKNAKQAGTAISFMQLDFLDEAAHNKLGRFNIIVSNPPYIPETESETLHKNVVAFEPGLALFVPGDDALLFYKAIATFGKEHLKPDGVIYCELHKDHAMATKLLFLEMGYKYAILRKDMHGNDRMLKVML